MLVLALEIVGVGLALLSVIGGFYALGLMGSWQARWRSRAAFALVAALLLIAPDLVMNATGTTISSPAAHQFFGGIAGIVALALAFALARYVDRRGRSS